MGLLSLDGSAAGPRSRERGISNGFDTLGDAELVAVLLGTGEPGRTAGEVAAALIDRAGGLAGLAWLGPHALAAERGVGLAKAARVAAAVELGRRVVAQSIGAPRESLASSQAVAAWAAPRLAHLDHEQVWVLSLDGRNGLRTARRVAEGGLHGCSLRARDVLRAVVRDAASAFVLVHNHPSGAAAPSDEDLALTRALAEGGEVIGTPLLDHVIIAASRYASLFDLGLIERGERSGPGAAARPVASPSALL